MKPVQKWVIIQSKDWDHTGKDVKWDKIGECNNIITASKILSENATWRESDIGAKMKTLVVCKEDEHLFDGGYFGYAPKWLRDIFGWDKAPKTPRK